MKVLIVDDEQMARQELAYLVKEHDQVSQVKTADSIDQAITMMLDEKPDILFLDIHLEGETGFDLAKKLKAVHNPPYLIFATAYDQYALEAFEANANDYILKPFEESKIHAAIDKYYQSLERASGQVDQDQESKRHEAIPIQSNDRVYLLRPEEIFLVSVQGHTLSIESYDKTYEMAGSLSAIEKKLPKDLFLKTHRSYLINIDQIQEIQPWFNQTYQVTLRNGSKVPVSRSYLKDFKDRLPIE
ncbi:LytR/AlgR family response regulator transcription factor [Aerococcus mictus]|uniref:LytR/AlgR family response regulator transcription factor n=1 Tax=Aerococcus mictus TaxID=2976810 RepID=UPI00227D37A4|nr:LytTR family transcriptional regulator DNA-binding domain-containing protein [Aerococcus mictus]MCY3034952.1 LytTR family transcriptional regulator DNA-binding domain-containing protein [Aerococcus mictus]